MLFRRSLLAALLLALPLLAGCGGGGGGGGSCDSTDVEALCGDDPTATWYQTTTQNGLTATLTQSAATVTTPGGSVTYTLTLRNDTQQPVTISVTEGSGGQVYIQGGISVIDAKGSYTDANGNYYFVYPSAGTPLTPALKTLQPGESIVETPSAFTPPHVGRWRVTAKVALDEGVTTVGPLTLSVREATSAQ